MKTFTPTHTIGRHVVSFWPLIAVFSCLAAYLIFPGPLDPLSYLIFPAERGLHQNTAQVSYTVSGTTTYPGIISLNIIVTNNDIIVHDYAILAIIGSNVDPIWWGPSWYRDNLAASTDVQNVPDPWWNQAFICTGPLDPGQSFQVTRKIEIANDARIKDTLVAVYDKHDASKTLAQNIKLNVINV